MLPPRALCLPKQPLVTSDNGCGHFSLITLTQPASLPNHTLLPFHERSETWMHDLLVYDLPLMDME